MFGLFKDIQTGALPRAEIPGFIAWAIRRAFWFLFLIAVGGIFLALAVSALR